MYRTENFFTHMRANTNSFSLDESINLRCERSYSSTDLKKLFQCHIKDLRWRLCTTSVHFFYDQIYSVHHWNVSENTCDIRWHKFLACFNRYTLKSKEKFIFRAYHMTTVNVSSYDRVQVLWNFMCNSGTHRNIWARWRFKRDIVYFWQSVKVSVFVVSNSHQIVVKARIVFLELIHQFVEIILN